LLGAAGSPTKRRHYQEGAPLFLLKRAACAAFDRKAARPPGILLAIPLSRLYNPVRSTE
jgi:hypothetical protein